MLPEIELEVLLFLNRDELDACQLSSSKTNQTIQRNNKMLALRLIKNFRVLSVLLRLFVWTECYVASGPPCKMYFNVFMRGTFWVGLNDGGWHQPAISVYEKTAVRMRNSFISKFAVYCMPCTCFITWLRANLDAWTECHAEELQLRSFIGDYGAHPRAVGVDEVTPIFEILTISKLRLESRHPEDLLKAQELVSHPLIRPKLKSLRLDPSKELELSLTDFIDFLFVCSQAERVDIDYFGRDASKWVTQFVEPGRPVVCERAVGTLRDVTTFFDDLNDCSCNLYVFKNAARKERLQVYCGSGSRYEDVSLVHFLCLQILKLE